MNPMFTPMLCTRSGGRIASLLMPSISPIATSSRRRDDRGGEAAPNQLNAGMSNAAIIAIPAITTKMVSLRLIFIAVVRLDDWIQGVFLAHQKAPRCEPQCDLQRCSGASGEDVKIARRVHQKQMCAQMKTCRSQANPQSAVFVPSVQASKLSTWRDRGGLGMEGAILYMGSLARERRASTFVAGAR